MKNLVVEIEEDQLKKSERFDLIGRSLTLALMEMGYPQLGIQRLPDKDSMVRFEIVDKE